MPAEANTITTEQICSALDKEFVENFQGDYDRLEEVLGLFPAETVAAGTALYQYKVSGTLQDGQTTEGEATSLSQYKVEKVPVGDITPKRYEKATTAEAILRGGYEVAIAKTDKKFVQQLRTSVLDAFFTSLDRGVSVANGATLQSALAQLDAVIQVACESHGDDAGRIVHFVNNFDIADYLGGANVTTQNLYGMTYLQDFLGVKDILVTNRIPKGTVVATPAENIHVRGIDFSTLADAGLSYETNSAGLIGVHHLPDYKHGSADTYAMVGADFLAEILNYIGKAHIGDNALLKSLAFGGTFTLEPAFDPHITEYKGSTSSSTNTITVAAEDSSHATAVIKNGSTTVTSGSAATWTGGGTVDKVKVTVTNGGNEVVYTIDVTKS